MSVSLGRRGSDITLACRCGSYCLPSWPNAECHCYDCPLGAAETWPLWHVVLAGGVLATILGVGIWYTLRD